MKHKKINSWLLIFVVLFGVLSNSCKESERERQIKEQEKLKPKVELNLRAAHVAYNVERYTLAVEKFEKAINEGWIDGIDLYKYAHSLEHEKRIEESKLYYQKAYTELQKFYPNHTFIQVLNANGYE